jgi:hypothetical protein
METWHVPTRAGLGSLVVLLILGPTVGCGQPREAPPPNAQPGFQADWDHRNFSHELWDRALQRHVTAEGLVDYASLVTDAAFREYLFRLAHTEPEGLGSDEDRLAFWINAYNALTVQGVLETLPDERSAWPEYSVSEQRIGGKSFWRGLLFLVGGRRYSLDRIEHQILRKEKGLRDPRIHVALVCAARGCPPLWNHAYEARHIREQLAAAMRRYVSDPRQCRFDIDKRIVTLSRIFEWYGGDFTANGFSPRADSVPAFLSGYVEDLVLAESLRTDKWRVRYLASYGWKLNLK